LTNLSRERADEGEEEGKEHEIIEINDVELKL
jgi:hypothetical protein